MATSGKRGSNSGVQSSTSSAQSAINQSFDISPEYQGSTNNSLREENKNTTKQNNTLSERTQEQPQSQQQQQNIKEEQRRNNNTQQTSTARVMQSNDAATTSAANLRPQSRRVPLTTDEITAMLLEEEQADIPTTAGFAADLGNNRQGIVDSLTGEVVGSIPSINTTYQQPTMQNVNPEYVAEESTQRTQPLRRQQQATDETEQQTTSAQQTQPLRSNGNRRSNQDPFYELPIDNQSDDFRNRRMPNSYRFSRDLLGDETTERDLINQRIEDVANVYQGDYQLNRKQQQDTQNFAATITDSTDIQEPTKERRNDRFIRAAERTKEFYVAGILPIEGMRIDDDGWLRFDDDVESEIIYLCEELNISVPDLMRLMICRIGISVDVKGNIMANENLGSWSMSKQDFIKSCDLIRKAIDQYGNPLAMINSEPIVIGGSYRFPVPPPLELCYKLTSNDSLSYTDGAELYDACRNDWIKNTQPALYRNTEDKHEQREAIDNMVRALHSVSSFDTGDINTVFNVSDSVDRSYQEILDDNRVAMENTSGDFKDAFAYREEQLRKAADRISNRAYKTIKTKDENGNTIYQRTPKRSNVGQVFSALASWERFAGILNPILVVPNVAEHVIGSAELWMTNHGLLVGEGSEAFNVTEGLYNNFTSEESRTALAQLQRIMTAGGPEAVTVFANSQYKLTQDDVTKFLNSEVLSNTTTKPSNKFTQWMESVTQKGLQGDFMMGRIDAKRFIECAMVNSYNLSQSGYNVLTATQLEEAFRTSSPADVIKRLAADGVGTQALVAYRNTSFGRVSPLSEGVKHLMRRNGVTDFLVTTFLCKYVDYGVNLIQMLTPFSNTMSYAAVKGLYNASNGAIDFTSTQLGGESINSDIQGGLKQCLMYDCAKLGQFGLTTLFLASIMMAMGFDDPDDPELIYNYDEYKIGGTAYKLAWWMNDLVGFGAPLAVAISVAMKHPEDPQRAVNVFWDGAADILNGTTITQVIDVILNTDANLRSMEEAFLNPDMEQPVDWSTQMQQYMWTGLAEVTKDMTPSVLNQLYRDTFFNRFAVAPNAYSVFTYDDPNNPYKTKSITDPVEINNRKLSQNNLIFAGLMNLMNNHSLFSSREDPSSTGYFPWEQAIRTMKDPVRMAWTNMFAIDYEDLKNKGIEKGTPEWNTFIAEQSENLKDFIHGNFNSVEEAIANGFTIPADLRSAAIDYYFSQIMLNKIDFVERTEAGEYYNWNLSNAAYTRMKAANQEMYDFIYDWLQNDKIPWSDEGYVQLLTDYQVYYRDSQTGEAATWLDWKTNPSRYEQLVKPYGNHPTSYAPFTAVDQANRGYNAETINEWYDPLYTDLNRIYEMTDDMSVQYGKDAGTSLSRATLGGYGPLDSATGYTVLEEEGAPTINQRSWITAKDFGLLVDPDSVFGKTEDSVATSFGLNAEDIDDAINSILSGNGGGSGYGGNSNSPAYKYWTGRGGSSYTSSKSSYSPKIYSNSRVLNFDKPATMYSKTPYGATVNYLRPAFYTKGSREAYRRQDM